MGFVDYQFGTTVLMIKVAKEHRHLTNVFKCVDTSDDVLVFSPAPKIHWPLKAIIALCFPVVTTILLKGNGWSDGFAISFLTTTFAKKISSPIQLESTPLCCRASKCNSGPLLTVP